MTNRLSIEAALIDGELWVAMRNGRFWRARRSGKTQLWKTRAGEFRIPIKAGMYAHGAVTHTSRVELCGAPSWRAADFVISQIDPNGVQ